MHITLAVHTMISMCLPSRDQSQGTISYLSGFFMIVRHHKAIKWIVAVKKIKASKCSESTGAVKEREEKI